LNDPSDIFLKLTNGHIFAKTIQFSGNFELSSSHGTVQAQGNVTFDQEGRNFKNGTVGEGTSLLLAQTSRGNVNIDFS